MNEFDEISTRAATPEELCVISDAMEKFKARWPWLTNLHPKAFTGTTDDILAIDYLEYEGVAVPLLEATLICGDVLQFGKFAWFVVRAAIDCYPWMLSDAQANLRQIVETLDEDQIKSLRRTLDELEG